MFFTFRSVLETQWVEQGSQQEAFWVAGDQITSLILLSRGKPQPSSACGWNSFKDLQVYWGRGASEASNPSNCISKEFWLFVLFYCQYSNQQELTKSSCFPIPIQMEKNARWHAGRAIWEACSGVRSNPKTGHFGVGFTRGLWLRANSLIIMWVRLGHAADSISNWL